MTLSRRGLVTLGVLGGSFLAAVEATIVATAMPTVVTQLGGLAHYGWVFSGYILTSTVTMPLWGKLSDLYGRRRFYLACISLFLLGSALCGAAQTMWQLIVFRAIQGLGAGGLIPLGMTILGDLYTFRERARTQGLFSGVWGLASIAGPLVGGYITEHLTWRWVFYLNVPFGLVAAAIVGVNLIEPAPVDRPKIDYRGAALLTGGVSALLVALGQTGTPDAVLSGWIVGLLYVASGLMAIAFFSAEARHDEPIVPLDLLRDPLVAASTVAGLLVGVAMFGAISFVPLFVQAALGGTPSEAGRVLSPLLLGWVCMSVVTGRLLPKLGFRPVILVGLVCVALGFLGLLTVGRGTSRTALYLHLAVMGVGMGMTMLSLLLALQQAVPRSRLGVATSLGQFTRSVGGAIGVAMMAAIIAASLPPGGEQQPALMETALHRAFVGGAVVSLVALVAGFWIPPGVPKRPETDATTASLPRSEAGGLLQ